MESQSQQARILETRLTTMPKFKEKEPSIFEEQTTVVDRYLHSLLQICVILNCQVSLLSCEG